MAQVVSSVRGSAFVTHDGGPTTVFTNGSYPCRVILNMLGAINSEATNISYVYTSLYGITSVGGVNVYNTLYTPGPTTSQVCHPILDHYPGIRSGGDSSYGYSNVPYGAASNNSFNGANSANVGLYTQGANNSIYNRQFWMMPGETLYFRTYWSNNIGYRYWNLTTITEQ